MPLGLLALAVGGFGIGLTEFVIMGLLPEIAAEFGVSEPVAGYLISGYALAVAVGAIALTAAVLRFDRKRVLVGLMVLFIAGNLLSALAGTYELLLAGRILAALCHGAFFGIGAVVAADMVAPERRAAAIAMMFAGLTTANVLGVPFGTFLGQQFGWRSTFWAITAVGVIALAGIVALVPPTTRAAGEEPPRLRTELRAFRSPQVWWSILVTILGYGGMFGAFTYIAYTLTEVSGFSSTSVPWLLVVFGAGLFVGNLLGGKAADRALVPALSVIFVALTVVLGIFALTAGNQIMTVVSLFLMGAFGFATVPGLQLRIMSHAAHAPTMASAANIGAFNIGNALGAWIGGLTIGAGLGYVSPLWAGAVMTVAALVALTVASILDRRATPQPAASSPILTTQGIS
ncbi:MFS transporter, DHA1 family, inner membrane transport protein [Sanguibacter gelidistatuariae]|uniref:MFS transporter, DHA1 family, inner membrane transport protein n=1 Tax=Sanguibacter gelidistatuariae TaxID=1814289 RepID=A0A1G6H0L7_9MICO|nr:MFS transporter [Sanguibacter gelidistatuariae]SDB87741.1 MFS transporter, DHA1 family, inner membrane transport protein [Sanguibacter gelidistatuariae]